MKIQSKIPGRLVYAKDLIGLSLQDQESAKCGSVGDILVDEQNWGIRYFMAITTGFFNRDKVLLSPFLLREPETPCPEGSLFTVLTKGQVESSPPLDVDAPISRKYELELARHFEYSRARSNLDVFYLSEGPTLAVSDPDENALHEERMEEIQEAHLRSVEAMLGYRAFAGPDNREIGTVVDFVVETQTWAIRYVVIKSSSRESGSSIALSTDWVTDISWEVDCIEFDGLPFERVAAAPEFKDSEPFDEIYGKSIVEHFGYMSKA